MTDDTEPPGRRTTDLQDAAHVIGRFGGIRPMASLLGVAVSTVQGWKERGAIPTNRQQTILEAAARHGVDLAGDAPQTAAQASRPAEAPPSRTPKSPATKPRDPRPSTSGVQTRPSQTPGVGPNRGIAWLALVLASVALIAIVTQPRWAPVLWPESADDEATSFTSAMTPLEDMVAAVERRMSILEDNVTELTARSATVVSRTDLAPLNDRIADLETSADAGGSIEKLVAEISALGDRLAALESDLANQVGGEDQGSLNASVVALSVEVAAWSARLATLEGISASDSGSAAALVLAVGQLDAAIGTGGPFVSALERVQTLGGDDFIVAGALAPLTVWAEKGIPTAADLRLRFKSLLPEFTRPVEANTEADGLWSRVRTRLSGLVTVRRVGIGDDRSPLTRSEQAIEGSDLEAAVAALEEVAAARGEAGTSWTTDAKARLAAGAALASLAAHALDELAKAGTAVP